MFSMASKLVLQIYNPNYNDFAIEIHRYFVS